MYCAMDSFNGFRCASGDICWDSRHFSEIPSQGSFNVAQNPSGIHQNPSGSLLSRSEFIQDGWRIFWRFLPASLQDVASLICPSTPLCSSSFSSSSSSSSSNISKHLKISWLSTGRGWGREEEGNWGRRTVTNVSNQSSRSITLVLIDTYESTHFVVSFLSPPSPSRFKMDNPSKFASIHSHMQIRVLINPLPPSLPLAFPQRWNTKNQFFKKYLFCIFFVFSFSPPVPSRRPFLSNLWRFIWCFICEMGSGVLGRQTAPSSGRCGNRVSVALSSGSFKHCA